MVQSPLDKLLNVSCEEDAAIVKALNPNVFDAYDDEAVKSALRKALIYGVRRYGVDKVSPTGSLYFHSLYNIAIQKKFLLR